MEQIYGYLGNICFFIGIWLLGQKKITGFYLNIIGNIFYIFQSIWMDNSSLLWLSIILVGLNINGIINWSKNKIIKGLDKEQDCNLVKKIGYKTKDFEKACKIVAKLGYFCGKMKNVIQHK